MIARQPAVIWGASGHAAVVADAARVSGCFEILGFVDELAPARKGESFRGSEVLGGREVLGRLSPDTAVLLGVGNNRARLRIADEVRALGFNLATVVHPSAVVASDVQLGEGVFVAAGAIINTGALIGRAVIINTHAVVEHDCRLEDGVHVSPGALLAGGVHVGRLAWVGIGAVIIEKRTIGERVQLGAGAVVVRDVPVGMLAYGVPATPKRPGADR